jgi:AcrR family transcriptional regulator
MNERVLERKESILKEATNLFHLLGYKNTDVQQIADALGIGKGTIYRNFPTKEDLFLAAVDRAMLRLEEYVKSQIQPVREDVDRIKMAIKSYIAFFRQHPEFTELFIQERAEFPERDMSSYLSHRAKRDPDWICIFKRLHAQGKVRCANFDWIVDFITNLLYGAMFTKVFQVDQIKVLERADVCLDMLLYGVFVSEGSS